jgi:hypothetical protein
MLKSASQTKRLSGRAQIRLESTTVPMTSTPPIVGTPCLALCNSASLWTSSAVRIGCPALSAINFRMTKFPNASERTKAVIAAMTARKVT